MRLVYVTVSLPFGPRETFLIPEVNELRRRGHELLIVPRSPQARAIVNRDADGLREVTLRRSTFSLDILAAAALELSAHPAASLGALVMLFRCKSPSTFVKNLMVFPKGLWLARRAKSWRADHIHAQWAATTATVAMIASRVSGLPWSFTAHRGDIVARNLLAAKIADARFARFISESGVVLAQRLCGCSRSANLVVLHLGVDLPVASPSPQAPADSRAILCAANLLPVKGHQYLFQAIATLKQRGVDCRLDVAGEGPLQGRLQTLARDLAIDDRVKFLGHVPHERLLAMLQQRRVALAVLPSVDLGGGLQEGIPVALIEAMSQGIPVISTSTGGIRELLGGGAGVLVPPKDSAALAEAIDRLLNDAELRRQLGEEGRRRVQEDFAVEAVTQKLIQYIEKGTQ